MARKLVQRTKMKTLLPPTVVAQLAVVAAAKSPSPSLAGTYLNFGSRIASPRHLVFGIDFWYFSIFHCRYKGRIIYNTRYQDSCASGANNSSSSASGVTPGSLGAPAGGASSNGGGRETRRSSRYKSSDSQQHSVSLRSTRSSSSSSKCQFSVF